MRKEAAPSRAPGRTTVQRLGVRPPGVAGPSLARRRFDAARLSAGAGALEPRGVGQMLDAAAAVLVERFGACFGVSAALWFPVLYVESMLFRTGRDGEYLAWSMVGEGIVGFVCIAFVTSLIGAELLGRGQPAATALWQALGRLPGLLLLGSITGAISAVGLICCLGPGVIAWWLFAVVPAVYLLERAGPLAAIARGVRLMSDGGTFLRWAGCFAIANLVLLPFHLIQQGLHAIPASSALERYARVSGPALDLCTALVGVPYVALTSAFLAVLSTVLYVDVRVRREGLDLELRLAARELSAAERAA